MPSPVGNLSLPIRFRCLELLGQPNNLIEFFNSGVLFVNSEFRIADDVDEKDMRDLEVKIWFML